MGHARMSQAGMSQASGNQARRPNRGNEPAGPQSQPFRREPTTQPPPKLTEEQEKHDTIPAPAWFDEETD